MSESQDRHDFELLGQGFTMPRVWQGMVSFGLLCAAIVGVVYVVLVSARPENMKGLQHVIQSVRIDTAGVVIERTEAMQIGFWTPSPATASSIRRAGEGIDDADRWQVVSEAKVDSFAAFLDDNALITAYRRHEVVGKGRSRLKTGYWWIATVENGFDLKSFTKAYVRYWENTKPIYLEQFKAGQYVEHKPERPSDDGA